MSLEIPSAGTNPVTGSPQRVKEAENLLKRIFLGRERWKSDECVALTLDILEEKSELSGKPKGDR